MAEHESDGHRSHEGPRPCVRAGEWTRSQQWALTLALAGGVILWQHWLHVQLAATNANGLLSELSHLVRDVVLGIPVAFVAVRLGAQWSRLIGRTSGGRAGSGTVLQAAVTSQVFFVLLLAAIPVHGKIDEFFGGADTHGGLELVTHAFQDAFKSQLAAFPVLLLALSALSGELGRFLRPMFQRATVVRVVAAFLLLPGMVVAPELFERTARPAAAQVGADPCAPGAPVRSYDVSAIDVDITLNRWGDHDPNGMMYVLDNRIDDVRAEEATGQVTPGLRTDAIQPLAIRANAGDCLVINFTNRLATGDASFHVKGLPYSAGDAAGNVGVNPNTLAGAGQTITYRYPVPAGPTAEGSYQINSGASTRQTLAHGLFGMLMIEPVGSTYMHPEIPGQEIESGWEAIIVDPNGANFREFVIMMHEVGDETYDVVDVNGNPLEQIAAITGTYRMASRALNYRSEPFDNRLALNQPQNGDKSLGYSSYAFGDPATPIPRSYLGEPSKTRIGHPGSEMFHIYHLHGGGNRWRRNPHVETDAFTGGLDKTPLANSLSTRMDSQSVGPGETYSLEHECGAGGCQQAAGDFLFHCHIGEHYVAGMWSFWRVFDTSQPDLAQIPADATTPVVANGGTSLDLLGQTIDGKTVVARADLADPNSELALEDWVEGQLPPQGVPFDGVDATVWDWTWDYVGGDLSQPLAKGEPESADVWPNFESATPGDRPDISFNLSNGRYSWPLFRPHLNQRPPFSGNGHTGAPWLGENDDGGRPDALCPATADRTIEYPLTAIDTPIEVAPGLIDNSGKLYVLNEDIDEVRADPAAAEPLVIRSNVGDCERLIITSEQEDANHGGFAKVNVHSHFTQFDPQASDGVITGFAYEQSVRPHDTENRILVGDAQPGDTQISVTNVDRLRVGVWIGIGLGEGMCDQNGSPVPDPSNDDRACTEIRQITALDEQNFLISFDEPLENEHSIGESVGVEFVQSLWYSDADTGTVFFHDHVDFKNWRNGLFGAHIIEPEGSTWHDPVTGDEIRAGTVADIHTPTNASVGVGQTGSFREMLVMISDDNPAGQPAGADGGDIATINLRSAPLNLRSADFPFSSVTNGDPGAMVRAYVGDNVVLRGLSIVEREDAIRVTGHRFHYEQRNGDSVLMDSVNMGVSEREDLVIAGGAGGPGRFAGDYLIHTGVTRNLDQGAWGLMRVYDRLQGTLQPLPNNSSPAQGGGGFPQQTAGTGLAPQGVFAPRNPCPAGAAERAYDVSLVQLNLLDTPWGGTSYVLDSQLADIEAGLIEPEPLVLRVAQGECLRVNFTNRLGTFAGFHIGKLRHEPQGGSGMAIGLNFDSSVDRNGFRTYRFYADEETGISMIQNLTDLRSMSEGAFGAVVVEPAGATWRDPATGEPLQVGSKADIILPNGENFREQVILLQETDDRIGSDTMPYPRFVSGFAGFNYVADQIDGGLGSRLAANPDPSLVYDSTVHGDPNLLLEAYVGDPVRLRVGVASGEGSHVFNIEGHRFPWDHGVANSETLNHRGLLPGESFDAHLIGGAGGGAFGASDYIMGDSRMPFHEAGAWGILRTHSALQPNLVPLGKTCNGVPITVDIENGETGTAGNDVILGTDGPDVIDGLGGDDLICGGGGADVIDAGDGNDTVYGGDGDDQITGGAGGDQLLGEAGNDTLVGGDDPDYINGGVDNDTLRGEGGDDILEGAEGDDVIVGGDGSDQVLGFDGADDLHGDDIGGGGAGGAPDYLWGGPGSDSFEGGPGDDWLEGGEEAETMAGNDGNDIILGHGGDDNLLGGAGLDYLWGGAGTDTYDGGPDRDTLDGNDAGEDIGEQMDGGDGDDIILGHGGDDRLVGGLGSDYLWGGAGPDEYFGGDGPDYLDGNDTGEDLGELMDGEGGDDQVIGWGGDDTLFGGTGIDYLWGGDGADSLDGGDDADDVCQDPQGGAFAPSCEVQLQ